MLRSRLTSLALVICGVFAPPWIIESLDAANWPRFRGPNGFLMASQAHHGFNDGLLHGGCEEASVLSEILAPDPERDADVFVAAFVDDLRRGKIAEAVVVVARRSIARGSEALLR